MRKLMENSKVLLGIASLVFAAYAEAYVDISVLQRAHAENLRLNNVPVSARVTLNRVPEKSVTFLRAKSRRLQQNAVAQTSEASLAQMLHLARLAPCNVASSECLPGRSPALSRAPPIS